MGPAEFIAWRSKLRMSQDAMAKHLGVARETVNRWEKGKSPVPHKYDALAAGAVATSEKVTPTTCPELYERAHKAGQWVRGPLHPIRLLGPHMVENEHGERVETPYTMDVLKSPAYLEARAAAHAGIKERLEWQSTKLARDIYPDAVGNESVAQYLARTQT